MVAAAAAITALWAAPASAETVVSLTFDDGNANQMMALPTLADHDMKGTFYIIPGRVGRTADGYMTWAQVDSVFDAGHEIGGHTMNHVHLTELAEEESEDAARDEICDGRQALLARGYPQVSFAYPFGEHDEVEHLVGECGYLSGRGVAGLQDEEEGEPDAESIPPADPWVIRTRGSVDVSDTLPEIKDWIVKAEDVDDENGSADAWMNLVFHHICDPIVTNCADPNGVDDSYITPQDFEALLDWLEPRESSGTGVRTIAEVMTGQSPQDETPPVTQIRCDGAICQSGFYNHTVQATLSATDTGGSGLKEIRYTINGGNPTTSSPLYTGPINVASTSTIRYRAWDNAGNQEAVKSQTISIDTTRPTSSILCGGAACSAGFYNATVSATLSATDNSGGSGVTNIRYTTNGSNPTGSSPIYSGPISVNSTMTIRFRAEDNAGNVESPVKSQLISIDTAKPTSTIQCDGASCEPSYEEPIPATLSGFDTGGSGVKNIRYTTNGSDPTGSSAIYSGPINVDSTTTIKWRAEDNAGNVESPVNSRTIEITSEAPPPPPPPPPGGSSGGQPGGTGASGGTLGAFLSFKSLPNGTGKLTVDVTSPGELVVMDALTAGASAAAATRTARIKRVSKSVGQAGEVTLVIRASKAGKRLLRRKGKLTVPVHVTFTPASGSVSEETVKVRLRNE